MRFALLLPLALAGCAPSNIQATRYLEVKCDGGLDADKKCEKALLPGSELEVRVNLTTQKVQITVTENDSTRSLKDIILDNCSVVDGSNWKCENVSKIFDEPITMTYGAVRGRYYESLVHRTPPNFNTSSVSE